MAISNLTRERLRELLHYDPTTGHFVWKIRTSNRITIGDVAGTINSMGYVCINIDGQSYRGHRLAWLYVYGRWPMNEIDHCDGARANNRFINLREATPAENAQNKRKALSNNHSCGLLGVTWNKRDRKWRAQIKLEDTKKRCLGFFATAEEAHAAYLAEKRKSHPFSTI